MVRKFGNEGVTALGRILQKPAYGEGRVMMIKAAIRMVSHGGMGKLTYRALAAEAKVTTGVLQHHFGSIDKLVEDALEYCMGSSQEYANNIGTAADYIDAIQQFLIEEPDIAAFQIEVFTAARFRPVLLESLIRHQEAYRQISRDVLTASQVDFDENLIEIITASLDGIVFQAVAFGENAAQANRTLQQFATLKWIVANYPSAPSVAKPSS